MSIKHSIFIPPIYPTFLTQSPINRYLFTIPFDQPIEGISHLNKLYNYYVYYLIYYIDSMYILFLDECLHFISIIVVI